MTNHPNLGKKPALTEAAPELLAALIDLREYAGSMPTIDSQGRDCFLAAAAVIEKAERAIAKATTA